MKRFKIVLPLSGVLLSLGGLTAAAAANQDVMDIIEHPLNAVAALRHLENTGATLAREHDRLVRLIDAGPPAVPPDPCADPGAVSCRQVHAVEAIDAEGESFLASVAVLDNGTDRAALERRLAYSTATLAWASTRIDGVATDFTIDRPIGVPPSQVPPDPCGPSVVANAELATSAAELAGRSAGAIDTCSDPASLDRRLGHVVAGLDSAAARLDRLAAVGFNPQPDPPGTDVGFNPQPDPPSPELANPPEPDRINAQLDAIIARSEYVASTARALKSTRVHVSTDGDVVLH